MLQPPGELVLAGQGRHIGIAEGAGRGHDTRGVQGFPGMPL
jgi:hypothetical protein